VGSVGAVGAYLARTIDPKRRWASWSTSSASLTEPSIRSASEKPAPMFSEGIHHGGPRDPWRFSFGLAEGHFEPGRTRGAHLTGSLVELTPEASARGIRDIERVSLLFASSDRHGADRRPEAKLPIPVIVSVAEPRAESTTGRNR
jgi:hypothetical protein